MLRAGGRRRACEPGVQSGAATRKRTRKRSWEKTPLRSVGSAINLHGTILRYHPPRMVPWGLMADPMERLQNDGGIVWGGKGNTSATVTEE
jgi:hypothetical protein